MTDLLVASSGGHLAELHHLAGRFPGLSEDATWVTFDTPQSRSLLEGCDVRYLPYTGPRAYRQTLRNTSTARVVIRSRRFDRVISTGAAPALSFLPVARAHRIEAIYIESAARSEGPSMTGQLLRLVPGIRLYNQYREWAAGPWSYAGSVFDNFETAERDGRLAGRIANVVVTLGTIGGYGFPRLVERLVSVIPSDASVLWQVGSTDTTHLPIDAVDAVASVELQHAIENADVVVAHAGIGSALAALEAGKYPILVPREKDHGEHVDDHQALIAAELDRRGLALARSPETLTSEDLTVAATRIVRTKLDPPPLSL